MQTPTFVGGDVSKAEVCCGIYGHLGVVRVANRKADLKRFLKNLPADSLLAVEATNTYHQLIVELAHARGLGVYVLNPRTLSHYANSIGLRAKTDPTDAHMIARYLAKEHTELRAWQPASQAQLALQTLIQRRATLVGTRVSLQQSLRDVAELKPVLKGLVKQYAKALAAIDKTIAQHLKQEPALARFAQQLRAIPGIGAVVSAALASLFARVPLSHADAAVAFVGLDPRPRESGMYRGQRKLSKRGPGEIRRLLYVAAMTTARHPKLRGEMERHRAKGLAPTAIYNILARKLVRTAWAMRKHQSDFNLDRFVTT